MPHMLKVEDFYTLPEDTYTRLLREEIEREFAMKLLERIDRLHAEVAKNRAEDDATSPSRWTGALDGHQDPLITYRAGADNRSAILVAMIKSLARID